MFIKFHFTFIQQHFCRLLFVVIWDILRVDYLVTSTSQRLDVFLCGSGIMERIARIMS